MNSSFDHANRSSLIASELLKKDELFSANEIDTIVTAIKNHSNKERIDDKYSELIKNADLLIQYLNDPEALLTSEKQKRINLIRRLIAIKVIVIHSKLFKPLNFNLYILINNGLCRLAVPLSLLL